MRLSQPAALAVAALVAAASARPALAQGGMPAAPTTSATAPATTPDSATRAATPQGPTLTLEQALATARASNPGYLQTANNRRTADAQVRSAYGALLPSLGSSFSTNYSQGGQTYYSGAQLSSSSNNVTNMYNFGLNYTINGATLLNPRAARANREAVEADINGAAEQLRALVTQQYLNVLQAQARAALQDTMVQLNAAQLELAKARMAAGAGTILDVRRAEVSLGQAQVQALTAHNSVDVERLRLFQQMGVRNQPEVQLTTNFAVQTPGFSLDSLLDVAHRNPAVVALQAREHAANVQVKARQSQYTPTLSLSTGWGAQAFGYTDSNYPVLQAQQQMQSGRAYCLDQAAIHTALSLPYGDDCSNYSFTDADAARIRNSNNMWGFQKAPFGISARLSLPIFDNFSREQSVEEAKVNRDDARYQLKARELQLTGDVTQAYLNLVTAAKTVELQTQNADKAREELVFAEERYKVGASTFLDVTTARATYEQAQIDRINSIYDYHKAFAALENAVGRPLR